MGGTKFKSARSKLSTYYGGIFTPPPQALFMLVSALIGLDEMKSVYTHAIRRIIASTVTATARYCCLCARNSQRRGSSG